MLKTSAVIARRRMTCQEISTAAALTRQLGSAEGTAGDLTFRDGGLLIQASVPMVDAIGAGHGKSDRCRTSNHSHRSSILLRPSDTPRSSTRQPRYLVEHSAPRSTGDRAQ